MVRVVGLVDDDQDDQARIVDGDHAAEAGHVGAGGVAVAVAALLGGAGLAAAGDPVQVGRLAGALLDDARHGAAEHLGQGRRHDLPQRHRLELLHRGAVTVAHGLDAARCVERAAVGHGAHGHAQLQRRRRHGLTDRDARLVRAVPLVRLVQESARLRLVRVLRPLAEAERCQILVQVVVVHAQRGLREVDVAGDGEGAAEAPRPVVVALVVRDAERCARVVAVDDGAGVDGAVVQQRRAAEDLEQRTGLERRRQVAVVPDRRVALAVRAGVQQRPAGGRQHVAVRRIQDQHRAALGARSGDRLGQTLLADLLQVGVQGQRQVASVLGLLEHDAAQLDARLRGLDLARPARLAGQLLLQAQLEAGGVHGVGILAVEADQAGRHAVGGIVARAALVQRHRHPAAQLLALLGAQDDARRQDDVARASVVDLRADLGRRQAQHLGQVGDFAGLAGQEPARDAHLGRRHRDGQRLAVAVVEIAALGVDDDLARPLPFGARAPAVVLDHLHRHHARGQDQAARQHGQPEAGQPAVAGAPRSLVVHGRSFFASR